MTQKITILKITTMETYKSELFFVPKRHDMKAWSGNEGNLHVFTLKLRTFWEQLIDFLLRSENSAHRISVLFFRHGSERVPFVTYYYRLSP